MNKKWPKYFMAVAEESGKLSKDPNTKVGAVIVHNKRIKSAGYNGAPNTFPDELVPTNSEGATLIEKKNTFMCHAELNAILNYDGQISDLKDSDLYVTISPCSRCACMIAQVGIKRVIYKEKYHRSEETTAAEYILDKCGVELIDYDSFEKENEE